MATDPLQKSISELTKQVKKLVDRTTFDVDTLTSEEIEELRLLIEHDSDVHSFSLLRAEEIGQKVFGMYIEFGKLNLVTMADGCVYAINPLGYWAVEKHDQRARERAEAEKDRRKFEKSMNKTSLFINGLFGLGGVILGAVITWLLTGVH